MKTRLAAALSTVVLALAACAWGASVVRAQSVVVKAPPEADARNWKEFAPPGEGFSVLLPGVPRKQTQQKPMPDGKNMPVYIYSLNTSVEYVVIHSDFPFTVTGPEMSKKILDVGAQGAAKPGERELLQVREISLGEHPGRDIKVRIISNGATGRARIYLVGSRLYQTIIATPSEDGAPESAVKFNEDAAAKFLDSFKLTTTRAQDSSVTPQTPAGLEETEGEVDRVTKELKAKNEPVYGFCADLERCEPTEGSTKAVVEVGKPLSKPAPAYPPIAKAARAQGTVVVQVIVDEEGKVIAAQAQSGHPLLQAAAVKAAREVRISPTLLDGKPVKISGVITYNFVLQ
jgi:TonB family protein